MILIIQVNVSEKTARITELVLIGRALFKLSIYQSIEDGTFAVDSTHTASHVDYSFTCVISKRRSKQ
jgi:hypothetical protein